MNNNNRGNNRRRGRGNNRAQGGGQQLNRIDSRARGNAPQMLEKYRKLAHDAHLNGDRVNAEYYLQFADHYFRVIADTRQRQEEQRARPNERWQEPGEYGDDSGDFTVENDFPSYDQSYGRREREDRDEGERPENGNGNGHDRGNGREERQPRDDRPRREDRHPREDRPRREEREPLAAEAPQGRFGEEPEGEGAEAPRSPYEPPENPFVRGNRGLRPRREDRRPRRDGEAGGSNEPLNRPVEEPALFDASVLPPSIGAREEPQAEPSGEEAPAPKRRGRKPKAASAAEASEA